MKIKRSTYNLWIRILINVKTEANLLLGPSSLTCTWVVISTSSCNKGNCEYKFKFCKVYCSTCKASTNLRTDLHQKKLDLDANGGDSIEYILQSMQ
jgi:hypothetical protein